MVECPICHRKSKFLIKFPEVKVPICFSCMWLFIKTEEVERPKNKISVQDPKKGKLKMTDLERFEQLLNDFGIPYSVLPTTDDEFTNIHLKGKHEVGAVDTDSFAFWGSTWRFNPDGEYSNLFHWEL